MTTFNLDLTTAGLFSGTYYTVWYGDSILDSELEYLEETENVDSDNIDIDINWGAYLTAIGNEYASELKQYFGDSVTLRVSEIWSPKYYNYDTDHITLELSSSKLSKTELETQVKNMLDRVNDNEYVEGIEIYIYENYGHELLIDNTTITIN